MNTSELPRRRDYTDSILKAIPGGQVVNPEGSVVDLPFTLPSGRPTSLRVSLPAHFPHDRPVLCVLVPLQHPAVDASGRVHTRGIEQWGAPGAQLGIGPSALVAVVREAFGVLLGESAARRQGLLDTPVKSRDRDQEREREGGPDRDVRMISLAGGLGPSAPERAGGGGAAGPGGSGAAGGGGGVSRDPVDYLEGVSTAQLEEMLKDEGALRKAAAEWLKDTPAARALGDVRRQNREVAASNLALARSIEEARGHVAIVRSGEYAATRALFEGLYGRQEAAVAKLGTARLLARVREEADKADAASDDLAERFQSGSLPVEAFVEQYVAAREAFHIIDLKRQAAEHGLAAV